MNEIITGLNNLLLILNEISGDFSIKRNRKLPVGKTGMKNARFSKVFLNFLIICFGFDKSVFFIIISIQKFLQQKRILKIVL